MQRNFNKITFRLINSILKCQLRILVVSNIKNVVGETMTFNLSYLLPKRKKKDKINE